MSDSEAIRRWVAGLSRSGIPKDPDGPPAVMTHGPLEGVSLADRAAMFVGMSARLEKLRAERGRGRG